MERIDLTRRLICKSGYEGGRITDFDPTHGIESSLDVGDWETGVSMKTSSHTQDADKNLSQVPRCVKHEPSILLH
jgi:hypothetical protein